MSGYYRMYRGWMDHRTFKGEPFSERTAWIWLIEKAAWKPRQYCVGNAVYQLDRGQLVASIRYLAKEWGWGKRKTEGYLIRLKNGDMISTDSGTGINVISICNYEKYQSNDQDEGTERGQSGDRAGTERGQSGDKTEEGKEGKEGKKRIYAWSGKVICLNAEDYAAWRRRCWAIPDFDAELASLDAYYHHNGVKDWFLRCERALSKKHQDFVSRQEAPVKVVGGV